MSTDRSPWYAELTRYHWFVFIVAALGWLFDTMDQQLFALARSSAMNELLRAEVRADNEGEGEQKLTELTQAKARKFGPYATGVFLMGWAVGGLGFGVLGDRIGRAKTMVWTILIYSVFTGLSSFSTNFYDFALYRFLTGLGVGGEFAVGVALVAEVMPTRARTSALGWLQALSAVGNMSAALIFIGLAYLKRDYAPFRDSTWESWRVMFLIGTVPALLAILIRRRLKEPDAWRNAVESGVASKRLGSYAELFGDPRWRRHALVGLGMAFAGVVGLWGIGFFSFDLVQSIFRKRFESQGMAPDEIKFGSQTAAGIASIMQNLGGFFGIYAFSKITQFVGRKVAFAISFVLAMLSTGLVFWTLDEYSEIFWMLPLMGFCQLALFGGYAIYFPELFPTRLRSTGTSFCYNVGRFVAAAGPFTFGLLNELWTKPEWPEEPQRYSGVFMCGVFLLGLLVLPFAPETKGKPLPE